VSFNNIYSLFKVAFYTMYVPTIRVRKERAFQLYTSFLVLALVLTLTPGAHGKTTVVGGEVNGTWALGGSPFVVQANIEIAKGATLVIEPGVIVQFDFSLTVVKKKLCDVGHLSPLKKFLALPIALCHINKAPGW